FARIPHADHVLPRPPRFILGVAEPDDGAALRADEVLGGDADRPAEPRGLADDLVQRMDRLRAADARDRLHLGAALEELHAENVGAKLQYPLQVAGELGPIGHRVIPAVRSTCPALSRKTHSTANPKFGRSW